MLPLRNAERPNPPQSLPFVAPGVVEVAAKLEVHPEAFRVAEEPGKAQCRAGSDASSAIDEVVHALVRYLDTLGELALSEAHRAQKLLPKHFSGVGRFTMGGDSDHSYLL